MRTIVLFGTVLIGMLVARPSAAQPGTLDTTFYSGVVDGDFVYATALQPDGGVIIGGYFTTYDGASRNHIARLHVNGSLDSTFNPGSGADDPILISALQPDGKIIIGGQFTSYDGTLRNRIARLNGDGTLDTTFNPGTGADNIVYTTTMQPDGKVIIGGRFTSYNGTSCDYIARLNVDGDLDTTFSLGPGVDFTVTAIALQPDGRMIIGGRFTSYNGTPRNYIARLNAYGSLDSTFNVGTGTDLYVRTIALQPDGRVIIGGWFTSYNGTPRNRIARLHADGSLDPSFNPGSGANLAVRSIALQPDGRIIIAGDFDYYYNGASRNHIARINADGTLDPTFNPGTGADNTVYTTTLQPDGKVIIGGAFNSYNGTGRNYVARVNGDPFIAGLSQVQATPVVVYPNPTDGHIRFTVLPAGARTVHVLDLRGAVVLTMPAATELDLAPLAVGVYSVQVADAHGNALFRTTVIKN